MQVRGLGKKLSLREVKQKESKNTNITPKKKKRK